jgi:hypothetical protein
MAPFCQVVELLQRLQIRSPDHWLLKGVLHLRHGRSFGTSQESWPGRDGGESFSTGIRSTYASDPFAFCLRDRILEVGVPVFAVAEIVDRKSRNSICFHFLKHVWRDFCTFFVT